MGSGDAGGAGGRGGDRCGLCSALRPWAHAAGRTFSTGE